MIQKMFVFDVVNGICKVTKNGISFKTEKLIRSLSIQDLLMIQTNSTTILL